MNIQPPFYLYNKLEIKNRIFFWSDTFKGPFGHESVDLIFEKIHNSSICVYEDQSALYYAPNNFIKSLMNLYCSSEELPNKLSQITYSIQPAF